MGCDIHMYVEIKRNNRWECGDLFSIVDPYNKNREGYHRVELYGDRDYRLFTALADVRSCDNIPCICPPKGLPDDATDLVKEDYADWGLDAHSASYLTLRELIDYKEKHDQTCMNFGSIVSCLIERLKRRADELSLIWDFEWDSRSYSYQAYDKANRIRIVFWFDN